MHMEKYELLLFDIDGTLLDFDKSERSCMKKTLEAFSLSNEDQVVDAYVKINRSYWERHERGEISKDNLLVERHNSLFKELGVNEDAVAFNNYYEQCLSGSCYPIDHAFELLEHIQTNLSCKMAIVTNGLYTTQIKRIRKSNLDKYFSNIYISDEVGFHKPQREFFEYVFQDIEEEIAKEDILIIGDSLSSDIQGGNNVDIRTCWMNPKGMENNTELRVDYEIQELIQLKDIIVA